MNHFSVPYFHTAPLHEQQAAEICEWVYDPPYDIYGWMSWDQMQELEIEFGDPELRQQQYLAVLNNKGELAGFAQLFPLQQTIRLGIGMRPDLCGHGYGAEFTLAVVRAAIQRNPEAEIDLEVLTWNQRAIRTYQKAGFHITDTYTRRTPDGMKPFYCMVYEKENA
ncbi:GNAT family N-acetyltransferase [Paenibacillus bovis]|uniref:Acetyltransferase n=1 Tax=Paenibacillus bovis TaxID=1616788 RepID=A0A172ZCB7_9BACL|nr:GNAT family N-acetyltransferase [Paenibacillus bovis]ANF95153.1 acetyltransferase [Paenibacillus bovis]